ncbi:hypothetical protein UFOVP75_175 [uncultured Caudovirales phage]|uniref:Uncharacterized protein n=1 Tax=uncultured Caudovirales phage TaxID=2100421 RepID=A0A6J5L195_9CAUD|nr:hypothetical protein UFOVP75_175 [uncultured Caudovirales phage]
MSEHYREVGKFVQLIKQMTGVSVTAMFDDATGMWVLVNGMHKQDPLDKECVEFWLDLADHDRIDAYGWRYSGIVLAGIVADSGFHVDRYSKWLYEKQRALWEQIDMVKKYKMEQDGTS